MIYALGYMLNSIIRKIGANKNDYDLLQVKRFIIPFESGICVIKHWRIHNLIQNDRYTPTTYTKEKATLILEDNKSYTQCIQNVSKTEPQYSIVKDSIGKDSIVKDNNNIAVSNKVATQPKEIPVCSLLLNDKTEFEVLQSLIEELKPLYPAVDINAEFLKMAGWLIGNPTKRKTKKGIMRFITNWLSKAQDKPQMKVNTTSYKQDNVQNISSLFDINEVKLS